MRWWQVGWALAFGYTPFGFSETPLGQHQLGLTGLWVGTDLGFLVMVVALLIYLLRIDWPEQSRLAVSRSAKPVSKGDGGGDDDDDDDEMGGLLVKP